MKLTTAQTKALEFLARRDSAKNHAEWPRLDVVKRLAAHGLVEVQRGWVHGRTERAKPRYVVTNTYITREGLAALGALLAG